MLSDLVLVYGMPGVGKSAFAPGLAQRLGLPRLGKDDLKETLWDSLERPQSLSPLAWSRQLGATAYELTWSLARSLGPRLVIEAPLYVTLHSDRIQSLNARPIEVFLWARPEVICERQQSRLAHQHACHLPYPLPTLDQVRAGVAEHRPLRFGGPLVEVDLSDELDIDTVAAWVRERFLNSAASR